MLTADRRKVAAEACGVSPQWFSPATILRDKDALTRKCAELIEAMKDKYYEYMKATNPPTHKLKAVMNWPLSMGRLNAAIASNNTDAIEELVYELITGERDE